MEESAPKKNHFLVKTVHKVPGNALVNLKKDRQFDRFKKKVQMFGNVL